MFVLSCGCLYIVSFEFAYKENLLQIFTAQLQDLNEMFKSFTMILL
jgi:hypothetical protein